MPGCYLCSNNTHCLKCGIGIPVEGGCTHVAGCALANSTLGYSANCISCNSNFYFLTPVNNKCVCKEGWIIGQLCGNIIGCMNLALTNFSTTVCISCSQGFNLTNGACNCKPYYFL